MDDANTNFGSQTNPSTSNPQREKVGEGNAGFTAPDVEKTSQVSNERGTTGYGNRLNTEAVPMHNGPLTLTVEQHAEARQLLDNIRQYIPDDAMIEWEQLAGILRHS